MKSIFSKDNENLNIKAVLTLGGALLSSLFAPNAFAEATPTNIVNPPAVEYNIMKKAGERAGLDDVFSLEEIITNIPKDKIPSITQNATNRNELKLYLSGLGLDLGATNMNLIDQLSTVVKTYYNNISSEITNLENLSKDVLAKINSTDQSTETAYELLTKNLEIIKSKTNEISQEVYKFDDLADILVATYHAAKHTPETEDEERIIELAKTIYPRTKDAAFGLKFYDHSKLKAAEENISQIIEVYKQEKQRLDEELKKVNENYLVMSKEEIENKKREIEGLIDRAEGIKKDLEKITQAYDSAATTLADVAQNSTNIINVHDVMANLDSSYDREKKAELSLIILPTVSYSNTKDENVNWSLRNISPKVEAGMKIPYSPSDSMAMLLGANLKYDVKNLVRKTDVSTKEVKAENLFGGFFGKVVTNFGEFSNVYLVAEGEYNTGHRTEVISSKEPEFRSVNEEDVSEVSLNTGLYWIINKEKGLLGRSSVFLNSLREGMNQKNTLGIMLGINNLNYAGLLKGELDIGFGLTDNYQIETGEKSRDYSFNLGLTTSKFNLFGIPSTLDALIKLYGDKKEVRFDLKSQIDDYLGASLSLEYRNDSDKEKETRIGFGLEGSF